MLKHIFEVIVLAFELAGVAVIVFGSLYILAYILFNFLKYRALVSVDYIRLEMGKSIILGLECFLASDLVQTVITPDYYQIGMLFILVIIRTILTYFLNLELDRLAQNKQ
jgi:uncharacterized membrane protein